MIKDYGRTPYRKTTSQNASENEFKKFRKHISERILAKLNENNFGKNIVPIGE